MHRFQFVILWVALAGIPLAAQSQQPSPALQKSPFVLGETVQLHSNQLQENRTLNIYLPAAYSPDSTKKYPVIYLLDGSADEDFIHIAGLVQFGTFPWVNLLPESIVVGIANVDRKRDFTFPSQQTNDKTIAPTSGGSAAFIRFIESELQPFITRNYHTDTVTTLIGQSLGGLLATEILFKKPELFSNYIIVSPSLWWDKESLLKVKPLPFPTSKTVYLTAGQDEHPTMVRTTAALSELLQEKKVNNLHLIFKILQDQDHGNILHWAVYDAFSELFQR